MDRQLTRRYFDLKAFRRWRMIQIVAILPLAMTTALMIYMRETSEIFVVAFFLTLIIGVLMPQISGDLILSHVVLKQELEERIEKVLKEQMRKLREELT
jgi:hypothetical protein